MKQHTLSITQRNVLERIRAVVLLQIERGWQAIKEHEHLAGCTPTEWVSLYALERTHHQPHRAIKALIRKGFLEVRPTNGWGPEVRLTPERIIHRTLYG